MFVNVTSLSKGRIWELRKRGVVRADNLYLVIILIEFLKLSNSTMPVWDAQLRIMEE